MSVFSSWSWWSKISSLSDFWWGKRSSPDLGGLSQKLGVAARCFLALPSRFLVCSEWHRKALSSSLGSMKFYFFLSQLVSFGCR